MALCLFFYQFSTTLAFTRNRHQSLIVTSKRRIVLCNDPLILYSGAHSHSHQVF